MSWLPKPGDRQWLGQWKWIRTDPGWFVNERPICIYGPHINLHTLEPKVNAAMFDGLEALVDTDDERPPTMVRVVWTTREWRPDLDGTLLRDGVFDVDASGWERGKDQRAGGMTVPAKHVDWILDNIDELGKLQKAQDEGGREAPQEFRAQLTVDMSHEVLSASVFQVNTVYQERDSPYD